MVRVKPRNRIESIFEETQFAEGTGGFQASLRTGLQKYYKEYQPDPLQEFFSRFLKAAISEITASHLRRERGESEDLKSLRKEIQALKKRLDAYDAMFEEAQRLDKEIEAEINAIETEPVNLLDYKPEDWLPTGEELEKLLDDE